MTTTAPLSLFTRESSMASANALNKSNSLLSRAMERLGTGQRINKAEDDPAGLQIATRLDAQSKGMTVAKRNIADATALLQTAEGAFDEVTNILYRMKDLATQSANDTNSAKDRVAINAELNSLNSELKNIMSNTQYAGEKMFGQNSKMASAVNFQIGAGTAETMIFDLSSALKGGDSAATGEDTPGSLFSNTQGFRLIGNWSSETGINLTNAGEANYLIGHLQTTLDEVVTVRSELGAGINRLGHSAANLTNMKDNTDKALGNIRDADMAAEASAMTRNQMLMKTSMSMLTSSNQMSGLVMNLFG